MNPKQWWLLISLDSLIVLGLIIFLGWRFDDFLGNLKNMLPIVLPKIMNFFYLIKINKLIFLI